MEVFILSRILKLPLVQTLRQDVEMPTNWRPLRFGNQNGDPMLWIEEHEGGKTVRLIYLLFTGDFIPLGVRYVGTDFFGASKELVVHCYVG